MIRCPRDEGGKYILMYMYIYKIHLHNSQTHSKSIERASRKNNINLNFKWKKINILLPIFHPKCSLSLSLIHWLMDKGNIGGLYQTRREREYENNIIIISFCVIFILKKTC